MVHQLAGLLWWRKAESLRVPAAGKLSAELQCTKQATAVARAAACWRRKWRRREGGGDAARAPLPPNDFAKPIELAAAARPPAGPSSRLLRGASPQLLCLNALGSLAIRAARWVVGGLRIIAAVSAVAGRAAAAVRRQSALPSANVHFTASRPCSGNGCCESQSPISREVCTTAKLRHCPPICPPPSVPTFSTAAVAGRPPPAPYTLKRICYTCSCQAHLKVCWQCRLPPPGRVPGAHTRPAPLACVPP